MRGDGYQGAIFSAERVGEENWALGQRESSPSTPPTPPHLQADGGWGGGRGSSLQAQWTHTHQSRVEVGGSKNWGQGHAGVRCPSLFTSSK